MWKGDLSLSSACPGVQCQDNEWPEGEVGSVLQPHRHNQGQTALFAERDGKLLIQIKNALIVEKVHGILLLIYVFEVFITISPSSADGSWHQEVPCASHGAPSLSWLKQCRNRSEREITHGTMRGLSQVSTGLCPQQFYLSALHSLGKVSDNGYLIQALTRRYLQNYLQNLQPLSLSHCVHICLILVWNTRSCSQLLLIFAVLGVSQLLELMGLRVKWKTMVPKWRERLSVD